MSELNIFDMSKYELFVHALLLIVLTLLNACAPRDRHSAIQRASELPDFKLQNT